MDIAYYSLMTEKEINMYNKDDKLEKIVLEEISFENLEELEEVITPAWGCVLCC